MPRYLVEQTTVLSPRWKGDSSTEEERTIVSWFSLTDEAQVRELPSYEACGFGTKNERVSYVVHTIASTGSADMGVTPRTVKDEALRFRSSEGGVDVGLKGKGWDPKGVYWDTRGNSFAVVLPLPEHEGNRSYVSNEGVLLCSINGIGEVRWTVYAGQADWPENREAVAHFGLTWTR
jgi:hypothetical protein